MNENGTEPEKKLEIPGQSTVTEPQPPEVLHVGAAFIVYQNEVGHWIADNNLDRVLQAERKATIDDFAAAAHMLVDDIGAQRIAQITAQAMIQMQQALAAQLQNQRQGQEILRNLDLKHRG